MNSVCAAASQWWLLLQNGLRPHKQPSLQRNTAVSHLGAGIMCVSLFGNALISAVCGTSCLDGVQDLQERICAASISFHMRACPYQAVMRSV